LDGSVDLGFISHNSLCLTQTSGDTPLALLTPTSF